MKKRVKTDSLTLRVDPRFRFALEMIGRTTGATMTSILERSIVAQATSLRIGGFDWPSLWHPEEAVRALRVAAIPEAMPSHEEQRLLHFCKVWWPFFYRDRAGSDFHEPRLLCLWENIDQLCDLFEETRSADFFAVSRRMVELLTTAGIEPPSESEIRECAK